MNSQSASQMAAQAAQYAIDSVSQPRRNGLNLKYNQRLNAWLQNRLSPTRYVRRGVRAPIQTRVPRRNRDAYQPRSQKQALAWGKMAERGRQESRVLEILKNAPKRPMRKNFASLQEFRNAFAQWRQNFFGFLQQNNIVEPYKQMMVRRNALAGARRKRTNRKKKLEVLQETLGPALENLDYDGRRRKIKQLVSKNWYGHGQGKYVKVRKNKDTNQWENVKDSQGNDITITVPEGGYAGIAKRQPWNRTVIRRVSGKKPQKRDLEILSAIASIPDGIQNTADCVAATIGGRPRPERHRTEKDVLRKKTMKNKYVQARFQRKVVPLMRRHPNLNNYIQSNNITPHQLNTLATSAIKNFGDKVLQLHKTFPQLRKAIKFSKDETHDIMRTTMDSFKPGEENDNPSIRILQNAIDQARTAATRGELNKDVMRSIMQRLSQEYNGVQGRVGRRARGLPPKSEVKKEKVKVEEYSDVRGKYGKRSRTPPKSRGKSKRVKREVFLPVGEFPQQAPVEDYAKFNRMLQNVENVSNRETAQQGIFDAIRELNPDVQMPFLESQSDVDEDVNMSESDSDDEDMDIPESEIPTDSEDEDEVTPRRTKRKMA